VGNNLSPEYLIKYGLKFLVSSLSKIKAIFPELLGFPSSRETKNQRSLHENGKREDCPISILQLKDDVVQIGT